MLPPIITNLPFPDLDLIFVEGGQFLMGDEVGDLPERCRPVHPVSVSSFYMAKYPVTQRLYQAVMGENPSYFRGDLRPVEMVSWDDAQAFIKKLNKAFQPPLGGWGLRLPTEAEWEYAARGGNISGKTKYCGSTHLDEVGWYNENSYNETKAVGLKLPNELGLYDMSGNVWEWCEDDWYSDYKNAPTDGSARVDSPERSRYRVLRGGCFFYLPDYCRAASRNRWHPEDRFIIIGFRLALSPSLAREQKKAPGGQDEG